MRAAAPPLPPVVRSDLQARLLAALLDGRRAPWTVSELAAEIDRPPSSVNRGVLRLTRAGILGSEWRGGARFVAPDGEWPCLAELRRLVVGTAGVPAVLRAALRGIPGAVHAAWAARRRIPAQRGIGRARDGARGRLRMSVRRRLARGRIEIAGVVEDAWP